MNMSDDYRKSLSEFIAEYIDVKAGHRYDEDEVIMESIDLLISNDVFSVKEMQKQALKDYSIIIPERFIKQCMRG